MFEVNFLNIISFLALAAHIFLLFKAKGKTRALAVALMIYRITTGAYVFFMSMAFKANTDGGVIWILAAPPALVAVAYWIYRKKNQLVYKYIFRFSILFSILILLTVINFPIDIFTMNFVIALVVVTKIVSDYLKDNRKEQAAKVSEAV